MRSLSGRLSRRSANSARGSLVSVDPSARRLYLAAAMHIANYQVRTSRSRLVHDTVAHEHHGPTASCSNARFRMSVFWQEKSVTVASSRAV